MTDFNIFTILAKDDKELVHSAFLKFLLGRYPDLYETLFNIADVRFKEPQIEQSYTLKDLLNPSANSQTYRIDIEVISTDGSEIVVIENKFKSFPTLKQKRYEILELDVILDNSKDIKNSLLK